MSDLPDGVSACGLKIPAGQSVGTLLITANENARDGFRCAKIFGRARIDGKTVTRPVRLASMVWPVKDASQEIPNPRLLADVPVSVTRSEAAPVTIASAVNKVWEVKAGDKLTIPLKVTWKNEFTGASIYVEPDGSRFWARQAGRNSAQGGRLGGRARPGGPEDPAGSTFSCYLGSAVAKYRFNPEAVKLAGEEQKKSEQEALALANLAKKLADEAKTAPPNKKAEVENSAKAAAARQKSAETARADAAKRMKAAIDAAMPTDIVDIVVAEPIRLLVKPKDRQ